MKYPLTVAVLALLLTAAALGEEEIPAAMSGAEQVTAQEAVSPPESTDQPVASVENRLLSLEKKVDALAVDLGKISGRASIADFLEREFRKIDGRLSDIEKSLRVLEADVRRIRTGR